MALGIDLLTLQTLYTDRGYTGHLHADGVGLIHMNGRMYDPILGRFISADPLIQSPNNLQSLNRYTYVMNNPLSYTDPTGYSSNFFKTWRRLVYAGIAAVACGPAAHVCFAMAYSARQARDHGADTNQAIKSAALAGIAAAAFHSVGEGFGAKDPMRLLAHGMVGGTMSAVAGGSFKSGFISAGLTAGFEFFGVTDKISPFFGGGVPGNAIAGALIGGVGSELSGGSFRRGAEIGAMSQLFNACEHGECNDLANEIGKAVLEMVPGVTAFQCLMNDCGPSGWAMAAADFTPIGKIAKIAKWGNRAHKALSVDKKLVSSTRTKKVEPINDAGGPHTTWKSDPQTGEITRHETWSPNLKNPTGWDKVQSTDLKGAPHINKQTGEAVPTPHTQGKGIPGGVRPADPSEIPKGNHYNY